MSERPHLVVDGISWYFEPNGDDTYTLTSDGEPTAQQCEALESFVRTHLVTKDQIDGLVDRIGPPS